ncbi:unnamed protein product [Arabidopsis halleri]
MQASINLYVVLTLKQRRDRRCTYLCTYFRGPTVTGLAKRLHPGHTSYRCYRTCIHCFGNIF